MKLYALQVRRHFTRCGCSVKKLFWNLYSEISSNLLSFIEFVTCCLQIEWPELKLLSIAPFLLLSGTIFRHECSTLFVRRHLVYWFNEAPLGFDFVPNDTYFTTACILVRKKKHKKFCDIPLFPSDKCLPQNKHFISITRSLYKLISS